MPSRISRRLLIGTAAAAAWPGLPRAAESAPLRIVSVGGAVTEILYGLNLGDRIVAVDSTSLYPADALRTKPNVGYMRQLSAEGILSARPSLVIAVEGAGPPDALKLVREAGTPVVMVPEDPTEDGVLARIALVAQAAGRQGEAQGLTEDTKQRFAALRTLRGRIREPIGVLFILSLQNGRVMAGGRNTTADGILTLAGARNVAAGIEGYKPISDEAIIAAMPEFVVMMEHGPGGKPPADLFAAPALSQTPAARKNRLVAMNGLYLLGFGPRTPDAARELLRAFYPGIDNG